MSGLTIDVKPQADRTVVKLAGAIDEDCGLDAVTRVAGPLELDVRDVASVNSLGIRAWVNMMKALADRPVTLAECPPVVVRQINMVPMFLGHARVVSLLAPYACDACDASATVLVPESAFGQDVPRTTRCRCGEEMELETPPDRLFSFLKRATRG